MQMQDSHSLEWRSKGTIHHLHIRMLKDEFRHTCVKTKGPNVLLAIKSIPNSKGKEYTRQLRSLFLPTHHHPRNVNRVLTRYFVPQQDKNE